MHGRSARGATGLTAVLVVGLVVNLAIPGAQATPRRSLRIGQNCALCHRNPAGGGLRTLYASQYLVPQRLAHKATPDPEFPGANPLVGDDLILGTDLRTFHLLEEDRETENHFLQMQASVYVDFQLAPRFTAYLAEEFGQRAAYAHEVYGLAHVLPVGGYLKAGRFVPPFGWKLADHRSFTRRDLTFLPDNPPHSDTGVEIGFFPGPCELQLAALNGEFRSPRDLDDELAFAARGALRKKLGGMNFALGGSYFRSGREGNRVQTAGPLAGLGWRRCVWIGEFDWTHRELPEQTGVLDTKFSSFTLSQQLALEITRGIDIVATHDFHDADIEVQTGTVQRVGLGVDALLYPFLALEAMLYRVDAQEGRDTADPARTEFRFVQRSGPAGAAVVREDFWQSALQVHFLY
jgi:hypothetical protein